MTRGDFWHATIFLVFVFASLIITVIALAYRVSKLEAWKERHESMDVHSDSGAGE